MFEKIPLYEETKEELYERLVELLSQSHQMEIPQGSLENQILEVIAYEQHILDISFNEITKRHFLQYFQLLGKKLRKSQEEQILVTLEKEEFSQFHKYDSFLFDEYIYELQEEICVLPKECSVYMYQETKFLNIESFLKGGNSYFEFPIQKESKLLFIFHQPLQENKKYQIYFQMDNEPLPDDFTYHPIWEWEYYSEHGWCPLYLIKEETKGLSESGFIQFTLFKTMKKTKINKYNGYIIRATLKENGGRILSKLQTIIYNAALLYQQKTFACFHTCQVKNLENEKDTLDQDVLILMKENDIYLPYEWLSHHGQLNAQCLLVYQSGKINDFLKTYTLAGISEERVYWYPEYKIKSLQILILYQNKYYSCPIYEETEYIESSKYGCYINYEEHYLCFGNGRNFLVPEEGSNIFVFDLVLHEEDIIHHYGVDKLYQDEDISGKYIRTMEKAHRRETIEEAKKSIQKQTYQHKCIKNKQEMLEACLRLNIKVKNVSYNILEKEILILLEEQYDQDYLDAVYHYLKKYIILGMQIKMTQPERSSYD